jgi:hypothetical protein
MITKYLLKADALINVVNFILKNNTERQHIQGYKITGTQLNSCLTCCEFEFESTLSLEELKEELAKIENAGTMVDTVNYIEYYRNELVM